MSIEPKHVSDQGKKGDSTLTIIVKSTIKPTGWTLEFPKTATVEDVINYVISNFGYATNGKYELALESDLNTFLQRNRPLVSYQIKDNDVLFFTDLGIAVCIW